MSESLKIELIVIIVFFLISLSPFFLVSYYGIPFNKEIGVTEATYVNGLITASGVFLGFITTVVISKRETLEHYHWLLIIFDFFLFFSATNSLFNNLLFGKPTISELVMIESSLNANSITAIAIIFRLRRGNSSN